MSLESYVFISSDLRSPIRMSVVALMNQLAKKGNSVTVITNNKSAFDDYRYDYRIVRRSFTEPFRNINTRSEILAQIASELPRSIFILTDISRGTVASDAKIIKYHNLCKDKAHKVVVWELVPATTLLVNMKISAYSEICESDDLFDAFAAGYKDSYNLNQSHIKKQLQYIPFFHPFKPYEYTKIVPESNQILFVQNAAKSYLVKEFLDILSKIRVEFPLVTVKFVLSVNQQQMPESLCSSILNYAEKLGIAGTVSFAQNKESFKSLVRESAFALVASGVAAHCDATVLMNAFRFPYLLVSDYHTSDKVSGIFSLDAFESDIVQNAMTCMLDHNSRWDMSQEMDSFLNAINLEDIYNKWEALLHALYFEENLPQFFPDADEAYSFDSDRILAHYTRYHIKRTAETLYLDSAHAKEAKSGFVGNIRKKLRYAELKRTQKYTYIQMSPEDVRRSQLLALTMLREFERICIKHGLTYYVAAGSLLGAARHKGQIPWDDDVDVTMPRKDYNKFLKIAESELPETMILPKNNFPYGFHRMQIKGTNIERTLRQKGHHGIFLDILPLDGAAPTPELKARHEEINKRLLFYMFEHARPMPALNQIKGDYKTYFRRLIIKAFGNKKLLHYLYLKNAEKYDVDKTAEWVCLPGSYGYEKECFPREYWGVPYMMEYENKLCPVMSHWEEYLTLHYGDYKQCPAELEKRTHLLFSIDFGPYKDVPLAELEKNIETMNQTLQKSSDNQNRETILI